MHEKYKYTFPVNLGKVVTALGGFVSFHNDAKVEYACKKSKVGKFKLSVFNWNDNQRNRIAVAQALCFAINDCKALSEKPVFQKLSIDTLNFYEVRSANHIWALEFLMPPKEFYPQVDSHTENDEIDVLYLQKYFDVPNKEVLIHLHNHHFSR